MYKINFILFFALCLGFPSTLYGTQQNSALEEKQGQTERKILNVSSKNKAPYVDWNCKSIKKCDALTIVTNCLKRWHAVNKSGELKNIFRYLSRDNNYRNIVGAYHHVLDRHLNRRDRQQANKTDRYTYINKKICAEVVCSFETCACYTRNQRNREEKGNQADGHQEFIFLRDLLDTMHAYLVHGYDSGHRYLKGKDMQDKEALGHKDDLFDLALKNLTAWQAKVTQQQRNQDRREKYQTKMLVEDKKISFEALEEKFRINKALQSYMICLQNNECDTDCILQEIQMDDVEKEAVIPIDKTLFDKTKQYFKQKRLENDHQKTGAHGFGLRLYYWDYYKNSHKEDVSYNPRHAYQDLYVPPAYLSFKSEMLAKKWVGIDQWQQKLYEADLILQQSPTLRKLNGVDVRYDIRKLSGLTVGHVLAILFYTNFTKLSAEFSASFRYRSHIESVGDVKKRNAEWHYLSKYLREVVEVFGKSIGVNAKYKRVNEGNFYHGITYSLFHEFYVNFHGPLSTSKRLEVATLFTNTNDGLILQLKEGTGYLDKRLKLFNVSLLSCFAAEDERLFIGGYAPLRIASIRLLKNNINTEPLIQVLFLVHKMLKGEALYDGYTASFEGISVFEKVLSSSADLPFYVKKTWEEFTHRQKRIDIHMRDMYADYKDFRPLFFSSSPKCQNLLRIDKIVKIFPNVTEIICEQIDCIGTRYYDYSSAVVSSNFILGVKEMLRKMHKKAKLKIIIIRTLRNKIADECALYVDQFEALGWQIEKGIQRIVLKKKPYHVICREAIAKISSAIQGERCARPITDLDVSIVHKLISSGKEVPFDVQHIWNEFTQKQQNIKINIGSMHDSYKLLLPLLVSPNPKCKNVLLFDKMITIFPNVTQITCEEADYDGDKIDKYGAKGDHSYSIVHSDYMLGLHNGLGKLEENQCHKLQKVITTTLEYTIKDKCELYVQKFSDIGWYIGKGLRTIIVTKLPYDDCICKISAMIRGETPTYEATSLDVFIFNQLISDAKDVPAYIKKIWDKFRRKQQRLVINVQYMYKDYRAFVPLLFSSDPKCKNLLLFGKLIAIFPNINQIICEATDNITGGYLETDNSAAILGPSFIEGLKDSLWKLAQYKWHKLTRVSINTYQHEIKCNLFVTQFGRPLGWKIEKQKLLPEDNHCVPSMFHPLYHKCSTIVLRRK